MKNTLTILFVITSTICWGQDTTIRTFKIRKIFPTAAGRTFDSVNRQELIDSGGITIHGCTDCKVLGFQMIPKTRKIVRPFVTNVIALQDTVMDTLADSRYSKGNVKYQGYAQMVESDPRGGGDSRLFSKDDAFTAAMKKCIENNSSTEDTYYIEITDIKVKTQDGNILTLDKICLFLK
jgi:hypothetical protein